MNRLCIGLLLNPVAGIGGAVSLLYTGSERQ